MESARFVLALFGHLDTQEKWKIKCPMLFLNVDTIYHWSNSLERYLSLCTLIASVNYNMYHVSRKQDNKFIQSYLATHSPFWFCKNLSPSVNHLLKKWYYILSGANPGFQKGGERRGWPWGGWIRLKCRGQEGVQGVLHQETKYKVNFRYEMVLSEAYLVYTLAYD